MQSQSTIVDEITPSPLLARRPLDGRSLNGNRLDYLHDDNIPDCHRAINV